MLPFAFTSTEAEPYVLAYRQQCSPLVEYAICRQPGAHKCLTQGNSCRGGVILSRGLAKHVDSQAAAIALLGMHGCADDHAHLWQSQSHWHTARNLVSPASEALTSTEALEMSPLTMTLLRNSHCPVMRRWHLCRPSYWQANWSFW